MANENISGNLPAFEGALAALRTVKSLGFRENEMEIPVPEEKPRQAEIPQDANFEELLDTGADSFHQSLLFSDFPYTQKGAFAFSMLSSQIAAAAPEPEKGTGARLFRFAKARNADWAEAIEDAKNPARLAKALDSLPASASSDRVMATKYAVHGDGRNVHCFMLLAGSWKELFTMPFSDGAWHVPGGKFLAAYSSGKGVYPAAGFHPSLGNLVFAATPYAEYCWVSEQAGASALKSAAQQFADFYDETYGLESSGWFADFFALSALIKNAAFAEIGEKGSTAPRSLRTRDTSYPKRKRRRPREAFPRRSSGFAPFRIFRFLRCAQRRSEEGCSIS